MSSDPSHMMHFAVPVELSGERLDKVVARVVAGISRARVQALIRDGQVTVDGAVIADPRAKPIAGSEIAVQVPEPVPATPEAEDIPLDVLFEDSSLIVLNKPSGLVVHPSAGHERGTLVNALLAHCGDSLSGVGGVRRPGIVHRLDRETSGVMVVAKSDQAHAALADQFASHGLDGRLQRRYRAFVWEAFDRPSGTVDARLGRSETSQRRIAVVGGEAGRHAVTHYRVEDVFPFADDVVVSELAVELETGRTHQIRVHMAHIRHPVLGDPVYGKGYRTKAAKLPEPVQNALNALNRQALHAELLGFEHPVSGEALEFFADLPEDIATLRLALEATRRD